VPFNLRTIRFFAISTLGSNLAPAVSKVLVVALAPPHLLPKILLLFVFMISKIAVKVEVGTKKEGSPPAKRAIEEISKEDLGSLLKRHVPDIGADGEWLSDDWISFIKRYKDFFLAAAEKTKRLNAQSMKRALKELWVINWDCADAWAHKASKAFSKASFTEKRTVSGVRLDSHVLALVEALQKQHGSGSSGEKKCKKEKSEEKAAEMSSGSEAELAEELWAGMASPEKAVWHADQAATEEVGHACDLWQHMFSPLKVKAEPQQTMVEPQEKAGASSKESLHQVTCHLHTASYAGKALVIALHFACVAARLHARLHACMPACLPACMPACLHACMPACLPGRAGVGDLGSHSCDWIQRGAGSHAMRT